MRWRKRKADYWERARVGDPLFHDPELQRAYWDTYRFFATLRALKYVEAVFARVGR